MSLWSDYIKECALLEIIEEPWGFVQFHAKPGGCLFINDLYIIPAERKSGRASSLVERAAEWGQSQGCSYISFTIHAGSKCATEALKAALCYGFVVQSASNDLILLIKSMGE